MYTMLYFGKLNGRDRLEYKKLRQDNIKIEIYKLLIINYNSRFPFLQATKVLRESRGIALLCF
jgi:hypothetical protein